MSDAPFNYSCPKGGYIGNLNSLTVIFIIWSKNGNAMNIYKVLSCFFLIKSVQEESHPNE